METTVSSSNVVQIWADKEFVEYVRLSVLRGLMGMDENSIIQVKEDLIKESGDQITFSIVTRLQGTGVVGDDELHGNEEALANFGYAVIVNQLRNGVVVGKYEKIKTKIDLLNAAKRMLQLWNMEQLRNLFLARMLSPVTDGVTTWAAATTAQKNTWDAANANTTNHINDRAIFGHQKSNSSGVYATDLANIANNTDNATENLVRLWKRAAQGVQPHIRPVSVQVNDSAKDYFVVLMGSYPFRDLEANFETATQYAGERGEKNRLFAGGEILIGNVACKEVPEMDQSYLAPSGCNLGAVGAGGAQNVEPCFFLGAQALCMAWAQRMEISTDAWDYQNRRGVAVSEIRGAGKTVIGPVTEPGFATAQGPVDFGMVTGYVAATSD